MNADRSTRVKQLLLAKVLEPTSICPRHNKLKIRNKCGSQICKLCDKERAKARALARITSGISPTSCPKCNGPREWDTFGRPKCSMCSAAEVKQWREVNPDKVIEGRRSYYEEHKEELSLRNKEYVKANKDKLKQQSLEYQAKHDREYWVWKGMNSRCFNPKHPQYKDWGGRGIGIYEKWMRDPDLTKEENMPRYLAYKAYIDINLGPQPSPEHSIDRIDNNKGYEPGNIRWATKIEQANNTRRNVAYKNSIPEESPIYYPYGCLITLGKFANQVNLPLIIAKYRYARNWEADWILDGNKDSRFYHYKGHNYNLIELSIISKLSTTTLYGRIVRWDWSVERAVETPPEEKFVGKRNKV